MTKEKILFKRTKSDNLFQLVLLILCGQSNLSKRLEQDVREAINSFLVELDSIKEE